MRPGLQCATSVQGATSECLTPSLSSALSPKFTPNGKQILFLSHAAAASSGVHNATAALCSLQWPGKSLDLGMPCTTGMQAMAEPVHIMQISLADCCTSTLTAQPSGEVCHFCRQRLCFCGNSGTCSGQTTLRGQLPRAVCNVAPRAALSQLRDCPDDHAVGKLSTDCSSQSVKWRRHVLA